MIYIYDILLNFNNDLYEFYEWEKSDYIFHIKKMPIYKVETSFMEDLLTKKMIIDSPLPYEILEKTEVFDGKRVKTLKYACLFTDGYRVIAVLLKDDFSVFKVSDLLLDEAFDAISIAKRCNLINVAYNIVGTRKDNSFLTRREIKIKKYLTNEFKNAYREKNIQKLSYLYFEYFNKIDENIEEIYNELITSLKKEVTDGHLKLYELVKLCHEKNLSNLTN